MLKKLKVFFMQLFCVHQYIQDGDIIHVKPHNRSQHEYYYFTMECKKCNKRVHQCVLLSHRL